MLRILQSFDPPGICARDLAECLTIQLRERDRFDPAMQALITRLDLLAKRDFAALKKVCGVGDEDLADMIAEIRRLNPKPGLAFGSAVVQPIVPDVFVRPGPDGGWIVELNSDTLPKVLVNQTYYAEVSATARRDNEKSYLAECLQSATWLVRALDQRARTILKVANEIVRQQDGFFARGVEHLRPLNLKTVAEAISMHESTVSRVTANKYMATNRGIFELKYFFTSAIAASHGGEAHSAEAVRHRIKQLIDAESAAEVLSDDTIVEKLREAGIDIARRTVAKYREAMRIPSSVQRRREKQEAAVNRAIRRRCRRVDFHRPRLIARKMARSYAFAGAKGRRCGATWRLKTVSGFLHRFPGRGTQRFGAAMSFRVSGKNLDVGEALRERIVARVSEAMGKYFDGGYSGHVTVEREGSGFRTNVTCTSTRKLRCMPKAAPTTPMRAPIKRCRG